MFEHDKAERRYTLRRRGRAWRGGGGGKTGRSGDRKRGKLMEIESLERRSGAPLGDSSKSWTAAGGAAAAAALLCVFVNAC